MARTEKLNRTARAGISSAQDAETEDTELNQSGLVVILNRGELNESRAVFGNGIPQRIR